MLLVPEDKPNFCKPFVPPHKCMDGLKGNRGSLLNRVAKLSCTERWENYSFGPSLGCEG